MAVPPVSNFLGRTLAPWQIRGDLVEDERILATAQVVLAISSLVVLYFDPAEPSRYANLVHSLLLLYSGYSFALFVILRLGREVTPQFSVGVHAADVFWPAVISFFTDGPNGPFFLYFIFALLAAAFRWGMRAAIFTALVAIGPVMAEAIVLTYGSLAHLVKGQFDLNRFIGRAVYLLIFGVLIGYMAELGKRRRSEGLSISQLSAKARVDAGLKGTLQGVFEEVLKLFGGRKLLLVTSEAETHRAYLWRTGILRKTGDAVFTQRELAASEQHKYLFALPGTCAGAVWRFCSTTSTLVVDNSGAGIQHAKCRLPAEFIAQNPFELLLMSIVWTTPDVSARLFIFEPKIGGYRKTSCVSSGIL